MSKKTQLALHKVVGRNLVALRKGSGVSQLKMASKLRITQPAVFRLESGSNLKLASLQKYSEALGFKVVISWQPLKPKEDR